MKNCENRRLTLVGRTAALGLALLSAVAEPWQASAVNPLQITSVGSANGKILLAWRGESYTYEVQSAPNLGAPNWTTVLATVRTNAVVSLSASAAFFRVRAAQTNATSLTVTTTNLTSGEVFSLKRQSRTNADLVFDNLTDTNASTPVVNVFPAAESQKLDLAFDGAGGFLLVGPQGEPSGFGGLMSITTVAGTSQTSYQGILTNSSGVVTFSALSDSAPSQTALKDGGNPGTEALGVGDAALSSFYCASAWAAQNLGCQSGCLSKGIACVGFFPPRPNLEGFCYITNRTGVSWSSNFTAIVGTCDSKCVSCCRDKNTKALSNCTQ